MERIAVSSSNLASVGYDAQTSTLEVEFLNGNIYEYFSVPESTYQDLISAPSVGSYFNENVRTTFAYQKI